VGWRGAYARAGGNRDAGLGYEGCIIDRRVDDSSVDDSSRKPWGLRALEGVGEGAALDAEGAAHGGSGHGARAPVPPLRQGVGSDRRTTPQGCALRALSPGPA